MSNKIRTKHKYTITCERNSNEHPYQYIIRKDNIIIQQRFNLDNLGLTKNLKDSAGLAKSILDHYKKYSKIELTIIS